MPGHSTKLTLEYWRDGDWYVGQLREIPSVLSQGSTLKELEENIQRYKAEIQEQQRLLPAASTAARATTW